MYLGSITEYNNEPCSLNAWNRGGGAGLPCPIVISGPCLLSLIDCMQKELTISVTVVITGDCLYLDAIEDKFIKNGCLIACLLPKRLVRYRVTKKLLVK